MLSRINKFSIKSAHGLRHSLSTSTIRATAIEHLTTKKQLTPTDLQYICENVNKNTTHEFSHKHLRLLYYKTCKQLLLSSQHHLFGLHYDLQNFANNCLDMYVSENDLLHKHPDFVRCMEVSRDKLRNYELSIEQKCLVNAIWELYTVLQ